jgi:hypothetical protein
MEDYLWQLALAAIGGGVLVKLLEWLLRPKKVLGYYIKPYLVISEVPQELSLSLKGKPIKNVYQYEMFFRNMGNQALKDLSVYLSWNSEAQLVKVKSQYPSKAAFQVSFDSMAKELTINTDLMNRGEVFTMVLLLADHTGEKLTAVSRQEDLFCKEVMSLENLSGYFRFKLVLTLLAFPMVFGGVATVFTLPPNAPWSQVSTTAIAAIVAGYGLLLLGPFSKSYFTKKSSSHSGMTGTEVYGTMARSR